MTDTTPERPWRPIPDPTELTTAALYREIGTLSERFDMQLAAYKQNTELRFSQVDDWRLEQKDDTRVKVEAALAAQEKAIAKQETATDRQLEQLRATFTTAFDAMRRDIDDLKARVVTIESVKIGGRETTAGIYALVGLIAVLVSIAATLAAVR